MLVELKNGETYNGILVNCDIWMNLSLRDVVCTSRDGDKFWKIPECYIRGNNIKYLRVPDEIIEKVVEEPKSMESPLHVFSPAFARHRLAHAPLAHAPAHARASVRPQLHTLSDGLHRVRRGTQGLCGPGKRAGRFRCKPWGGGEEAGAVEAREDFKAVGGAVVMVLPVGVVGVERGGGAAGAEAGVAAPEVGDHSDHHVQKFSLAAPPCFFLSFCAVNEGETASKLAA